MQISVVIPAFQAAATLAETLHSIGAQTRQPDEVIVVDDGSTDGTADIARTAMPSARVITQANAGAAAATNVGVAAARGDLLAMLDADDLWMPGKLAAQEAALREAPHLAGIGGGMESFACPSLSPAMAARMVPQGGAVPCLLAGAVLLRRAVHDTIGPYDEALRVGYTIDWMHRARLAGALFDVLPEVVLRRRIRAGSLSSRAGGSQPGFLAMARLAIARRRAV